MLDFSTNPSQPSSFLHENGNLISDIGPPLNLPLILHKHPNTKVNLCQYPQNKNDKFVLNIYRSIGNNKFLLSTVSQPKKTRPQAGPLKIRFGLISTKNYLTSYVKSMQ